MLTRDTYLESASEVEEGISKLALEAEEIVDSIGISIDTILTKCDHAPESIWSEVCYDIIGDKLDNPDEYDWFTELSEDEMGQFYDAWEEVAKLGDVLSHYQNSIKQITQLAEQIESTTMERLENW